MIAYLDTSVLLRVLLNQTNRFSTFGKLERPISSRLLKAESLRSLDRLRIRSLLSDDDYLKACEELYEAMDSIEFIEIDNRVLERVGHSFSLPLGTLAAIHLASALVWQEHFGIRLNFLTHDEELSRAAKAHGFPVLP